MPRLLMLLSAVVLATACTDTIGGVDEDIAGYYDLVAIEGDPLPILFHDSDSLQVEITAAEIFMGINGVYREVDTFRLTRESGVEMQVDTFTADWIIGPNNVLTVTTQTSSGPQSFSGAWNGANTLTFDVGGLDWVWRHR